MTAVRTSALLPCPAWCAAVHDYNDDVEGNGYRFHIALYDDLDSGDEGGETWTTYRLSHHLTRYDDHHRDLPRTETRLRICLDGEADCSERDLRDLALWLLMRADELAAINAGQ